MFTQQTLNSSHWNSCKHIRVFRVAKNRLPERWRSLELDKNVPEQTNVITVVLCDR